MGWSWHGWYMGWMALFWIALVLVLIWLIPRSGTSSTSPAQPRESPEEILKRRYASGEISEQDYQRMLAEVRR